MNRPTINCYMETSLDGKSVGSFWDNERGAEYVEKYFEYYDKMDPQGFIVGWVTVLDWDYLLEEGNKLDLPEGAEALPREDFVAENDYDRYIVVIDRAGKLAWKTDHKEAVDDHKQSQSMHAQHIVTVLTEQVPDAYLQHLREVGVSYVFAGKDKIDLHLAMEKLHDRFGLEDLVLMGGARMNGSFVREGLVDRYTALMQATIAGGDCNAPTKTSVEANPGQGYMEPVDFLIESVEQIDNTGLFMTFVRA